MAAKKLKFEQIPGSYAVCRLSSDAPIPSWACGHGFCSITRTDNEVSIVALEGLVPRTVEAERGWVGLRIVGTLDVDETGILAQIAGTLADAGVPIFVISTFDTDYVFVRDTDVATVRSTLQSAGHTFYDPQP